MGSKSFRWVKSDNKLYFSGPCKGCAGKESTFVPLYWDPDEGPPGNSAYEIDEDDEGNEHMLFEWDQCVIKCIKCKMLAIAFWVVDPSRETDEKGKPQPFLRYAELSHKEPNAPARAALPSSTPYEITTLVREAETCVGAHAFRSAAAMFRAAMEKTLKFNGYDQSGNLEQRIKLAASERMLTIQLETRAHKCRSLGNESLHEGKAPSKEDVEDIYGLVLLLIESFYRTRKEVVAELRKLKRRVRRAK